jgi:hypothetical protein
MDWDGRRTQVCMPAVRPLAVRTPAATGPHSGAGRAAQPPALRRRPPSPRHAPAAPRGPARRPQVWRSPECDALYGQLRPGFEQLPGSFRVARAYHLGIHAAHAPMRLLRSLRAAAHAQGGAFGGRGPLQRPGRAGAMLLSALRYLLPSPTRCARRPSPPPPSTPARPAVARNLHLLRRAPAAGARGRASGAAGSL